MSILKRIVKAEYQTTDGKTFNDKGEAAKHQAGLDRLVKIANLLDVNAAKYAATVNRTGDTTSENWGTFDFGCIARFIVDYADALREILPKRAKPEKGAEPAPAATATGPSEAVLHATGDAAVSGPVGAIAADLTTPAKTVAPFNWPVGLEANVAQQAAA